MGRKNSPCRKKKSANARLPLSCEVRGRRRDSSRPLTPVSGVAAGAIRSERNEENPIGGSRDRAGEDASSRGKGKGGARGRREEEKKEENWETCARGERSMKSLRGAVGDDSRA